MTIHEFLEQEEFVKAVHNSLDSIIKMILKEDIAFGILTNITHVSFSPELPKNIMDMLKTLTLFELDGYTLSTATLKDGFLEFEAGFGEDNFASLVKVSLSGVIQVLLDKTPIFLNMSVAQKKDEIPNKQKTSKDKQNSAKRSMEALLNNPKNKNLLKNS